MSITIGVIATNQSRKDYALAAAVAARVREAMPDIRWWWHVDQMVNPQGWSIPALVEDYGLTDLVTVTLPPMDDTDLAERYRQCALTLAIGPEGFGLPIIESLACGVPVLHMDYAGGASVMSTCDLKEWLIAPVTYRVEGIHNYLRPVHDPEAWAEMITWALDPAYISLRPDFDGYVDHLDWDHLKHPWRRWFRDGLGVTRES